MLCVASLPAFAHRGHRAELTKLCDMLGSEPDLQTHVNNWRDFPPAKIGELKLLILFQLSKTMTDAEEYRILVFTHLP